MFCGIFCSFSVLYSLDVSGIPLPDSAGTKKNVSSLCQRSPGGRTKSIPLAQINSFVKFNQLLPLKNNGKLFLFHLEW